jgi:signal transduction histidine kinase
MDADKRRDRLALEDPLVADVGGLTWSEVLSLAFDVRAPLHVVAGYLGMVTPPAELAGLAPGVMAAVNQVERLVEGAVDLARGRAGLLVRAPIDLAGFWQRVQRECAGLVEFWHPGGALCFAINGAPAVAMGDEAALRRALLNLIENALYWSAQGQVAVVSGQAHHAWVVEVISGEPGLPADVLPALPDPAAGGGPLGLRQAWAVARGHGGWLAVAAGRMQLVIPLAD